ncbi:MlaD family protein [Polaromonas sp.]|uniref:MlaD family protein n=1 Tax=Polaromonas sp. TaxID=1869339 RepID=UPI002FC976F5
MENKAHAMAAGVFVLAVTALLVALAVWLIHPGSERHLYELSTRESVSGLRSQAPVRFRGVPVGKVEHIGFDHKVKGNVLVRIAVDRGAPMTRSTFATVSTQGVTGLGFIQLDDKGESTEPLPPNDSDPPRIPLRPGFMDKLMKQGEATFNQIEQASTRLNQLLGPDNQQVLINAVRQAGAAAESLGKTARQLDDKQAVQTLKTAAENISRTASEAGLTMRRLNEKGGPMDKMTQGSAALATAAQTFDAATLPRLHEVAEESARTLRQVRRTAGVVDDNPQALIFGHGQPPPGPGEPGFTAPGASP